MLYPLIAQTAPLCRVKLLISTGTSAEAGTLRILGGGILGCVGWHGRVQRIEWVYLMEIFNGDIFSDLTDKNWNSKKKQLSWGYLM